MATKRSSGLDFSDKRVTIDALAAHPDVLARAPKTTNLQRNKTERHRLQGLMRNAPGSEDSHTSTGGKVLNKLRDEKVMDRWHTWLINGGRARIIFAAYVFLHLIVFIMGFLNYQLQSNYSITRSIVGLGFGEPAGNWPVVGGRGGDRLPGLSPPIFCYYMLTTLDSDRSYSSSCPSRRRHLHPIPRLPKLHLSPPPNGTE